MYSLYSKMYSFIIKMYSHYSKMYSFFCKMYSLYLKMYSFSSILHVFMPEQNVFVRFSRPVCQSFLSAKVRSPMGKKESQVSHKNWSTSSSATIIHWIFCNLLLLGKNQEFLAALRLFCSVCQCQHHYSNFLYWDKMRIPRETRANK